MNKLFFKLSLAGVTCFGIAAASPVFAQDNNSGKLGEYDEIILKGKDGKDGKVTVEIKDGQVYVDGKKIDEYKGSDISVYQRRNAPVDGNTLNFRSAPRGGMQFYRGEDALPVPRGGKAILGVITAKEEAAGATVKEVSEGSAAAKAGLKVGDVITKINSDNIKEPQELFESIGALKPGEEVTITYLRNKKENKVTAKLGERPQTQQRSFSFGGDGSDFSQGPPRGSDLEDLFRGIQRYGDRSEGKLGLSVQDTEEGNGVKVLDVAESSAAEKAGFKKDDVITELAGSSVRSARDVVNIYNTNKEKSEVTAKIIRDKKTQTITVKVPKKLNKADL